MGKWNLSRIAAAILMSGFLLGILYVNLFAKNYVLSMGVYSDLLLQQFSRTELRMDEFILYVTKMRVIPIALLSILGCTKYKKAAGYVSLLWTGFSFGIIMTTAVLNLNIKGIFLCLFGMCPHFICYIAAYVMLLIYLIEYPGIRWNYSKTVSFILFILLGIITECYINPVLMNIFVKAL